MTLYIVVRNYLDHPKIEEGVMLIESVWTTREQAETALMYHARAANMASHLYSIIERNTDQLLDNKNE